MTAPALKPPPPVSAPINETGPTVNFSRVWSGWFRSLFSALGGGFTGSVILTKQTVGGTNGSLTVVNGIITAYTAPT